MGTPQIINKKLVKDINDNCWIDGYFSYTDKDWEKYRKRCKLSTFSSNQSFKKIFEELQKNKIVYLYQSKQLNIYLKKRPIQTFVLLKKNSLKVNVQFHPPSLLLRCLSNHRAK